MFTAMKEVKGHRKVILAAAAVMLACSALFVGTPPASASSGPVRLAEVTLVGYDLEDWWPDWVDEISVNYNRVQAGPVLNVKQNISYSVVGSVFTGTLTVELFEWDRGVPRALGEQTISATEVGQGERTRPFGKPKDTNADFSYELRYKVVPL